MDMPIYEFRCKDCNYNFEELLKISESDKKISCPKCQSYNTKKVFSIFGTSGTGGSAGSCDFTPSCGSAGFG